MKLCRLVILLFLILLPVSLQAESAWQNISEKDGIQVFRRETSGSNLYEFRGRGLVEAGLPKIIALITDTRLMPDWVHTCISPRLVEKNYEFDSYDMEVHEYYQIIYIVNHAPWPLKNRDYTFRAHLEYQAPQNGQPECVVVDSKNIDNDKIPAQPDKVRMPLMHSRMSLTNMDADGRVKTLVDFAIQIDPGGIIPDWIINLVSRNVPYKTIMCLRSLVLREDYDKRIENLVSYHVNRLHAINNP